MRKSKFATAAMAAEEAYDAAVKAHRAAYNAAIIAATCEAEKAAAWSRYVALTRPAQAAFEAAIAESRATN